MRQDMPPALITAVLIFSPDSRELAFTNWEGIGEDGRDSYRQYVNRAWTQRTLRKRAALVAVQLLDPGGGFQIPDSGGFY